MLRKRDSNDKDVNNRGEIHCVLEIKPQCLISNHVVTKHVKEQKLTHTDNQKSWFLYMMETMWQWHSDETLHTQTANDVTQLTTNKRWRSCRHFTVHHYVSLLCLQNNHLSPSVCIYNLKSTTRTWRRAKWQPSETSAVLIGKGASQTNN